MKRGSMDLGIISSEIIKDENGLPTGGGRVIGINLGWDFTAEHERGISGINEAFGITGRVKTRALISKIGVDVYTVGKVPKWLEFFEDVEGYSYLVYNGGFYSRSSPQVRDAVDGENISTAWDERSFAIRIKNESILEEGTIILGQIYDAFTKKDIIIFLKSSDNPFSNGGLTIAIRSRIPVEVFDLMKENHRNLIKLKRSFLGTGIEKRLKKAGRSYFALEPAWKNSNGPKDKTNVEAFLNPHDQNAYNSGWFTIDDLDSWIQKKGPVMKQ